MRALVLIGALLAGFVAGWGVAASPAESDDGPAVFPAETQEASSTHAAPFYVDPDETALGTAVLVAESVSGGNGRIAVRYALHPITPVDPALPGDAVAAAFPNGWALETTSGTSEGSVSFPNSRSVEFEVPAEATSDDVTALRVTSLMLPLPIDEPFALGADGGSVALAPGVRADLHRVLVQGEQTLVQVALSGDPAFQTAELGVTGDGVGWLSAVSEAEGRPRWTLRYDGSDLPDPIPLRARGIVWVALAVDIPVALPVSDE